MRETILFDKGWLFHKGDIVCKEPEIKGPIYTSAKTERMKWGPACIYYNDSARGSYEHNLEFNGDKWTYVDLPHDYIVAGEVSQSNNEALGFFKYENAWYRKHFEIPASDDGKRITLLFEGVATRTTVYLNGCELKHNFCGYTSFEVDITDYIRYGSDNVLAVYVEYHKNEGWWYQGGGIYRHVWLTKTEDVSVDLWGVFVHAQKNGDEWKTFIETEVRNDSYEEKSIRVVNRMLDKDKNEILCTNGNVCISPRDKNICKCSGTVLSPHLWDIDDPYIYDVVTELYDGEVLIDTVNDRFGYRDFAFTAEGFFLNGKKTFIYGMCGHGDFGLTGKAVPDNILRYKVKLLKEMGANGYRTSHYPQAAAFMDALDENGFIVMDETRWFDSTPDGIEQLTMLIKRDRNRPCVFMWSLGNEEPHHLTETGRKINKALIAHAKKLDPTRPTTSAVSNSPDKATVYDDMELVGINYNHMLYDVVRAKYPDKPIYASECCAAGTTRSWYADDEPMRAYVSAFDHDITSWFIGREKFMKVVSEHPWLCGMFQWIAFEHRGEAIWPRLCSVSGAIDLFMQKKDAFYQNQSIFMTSPMIHLLPHWNILRDDGELVKVTVYTTCEEAELFLNGVSLGRKKAEKYVHLEWDVPYHKGRLEVIGYIDGKEAACDMTETTKSPARLMLKCENADDICVNGEDIALFTCYCVDEDGKEVPDASPFVSFHSNGIGTIVGTGSDNTDHISVACPDRKMFMGKITVGIKLKENAGQLCVWAESEHLAPARIKVDVE